MASDRSPRGAAEDDAATTAPVEAESDGAGEADTEGHMMLPDSTSRWLAQDREREIRKHLSDRQLERQSKDSRPRK